MKTNVKSLRNGKLISPFHLAPKQVNGASVVNNLRQKLGVDMNDVKTFNTPLITASSATAYNKYAMKLEVDGSDITITAKKGRKVIVSSGWNLNDVVRTIQIKNPSKNITRAKVVKLLAEGKLGVKFNVSALKDHGTKWSLV